MKKYYCYLLECSDRTLYCGFTNDLEKRLATHNLGKGAKYTRSRIPCVLVYYEEFDNKSAALKREAQIKKLSHVQKLNLIKSKY